MARGFMGCFSRRIGALCASGFGFRVVIRFRDVHALPRGCLLYDMPNTNPPEICLKPIFEWPKFGNKN